jgi:hypothetical protein
LKTPAEGIHRIKLKTYKQACSNVLSLPSSKRKKIHSQKKTPQKPDT